MKKWVQWYLVELKYHFGNEIRQIGYKAYMYRVVMKIYVNMYENKIKNNERKHSQLHQTCNTNCHLKLYFQKWTHIQKAMVDP